MSDLFQAPECVIHEVNVTVDPDKCVKCGAVNRWVVPVSIDYEAAERIYDLLGTPRAVVDAALGVSDE